MDISYQYSFIKILFKIHDKYSNFRFETVETFSPNIFPKRLSGSA